MTVIFSYSGRIRSEEVATIEMSSENGEQDLDDGGSVTLRPVSALVPEHVSRGVFSTGVIAITGNTEFVLDFVLTIGTPSTVVSRVVCTHDVLRRIVAAIRRNVESFTGRVGALESEAGVESAQHTPPLVATESPAGDGHIPDSIGTEQFVGASIPVPGDSSEGLSSSGESPEKSGRDLKSNAIKQNPLDLYDDIIVPDEVQVGVYANGLIIGHTNSEFKLDFVSNMFPKSVVTSRIFMSAPQLVRLLDTLERTVQQFDEKHSS
ncbi:MAG TPA: DUF3467 domain-containing protein [Planctomycetaceae bacterium]|nr:DUF3467 domain-containing protein [Planctomycetaceae bacterium]